MAGGSQRGVVAGTADWLGRHERILVVAVFSLVAVFGAAYAVVLGDAVRFPDEQEYLDLARALAETGRFAGPDGRLTAYRPPGYPLVLAPLVWLGADVVVLRLLNVAFHVGAALLAVVVARRIAPPPAGVLTALVTGLSPVAVYTAGTLYAQTLTAVLLMAALVLVLRVFVDDVPRVWAHVAGAGALLGWLVVTTPTALGAAAFVVAWAIWWARRRNAWRAAIVLALVTALFPAAWAVRNTLVFDTPVGLGTQTGINLLLGNSEHTRPNSGVNVDLDRYHEVADDLDEVQRDRYYARAALDWIRANPGDAARLYVAKVVNFFNYRNELYVTEEASPTRDLVVLGTYWPLLAIVVVRLLAMRREPPRPAETLILGVYVAAALSLAVFFTRIRFRVPFDYGLGAVAAAAIALALARRRHDDAST